MFDVLLHIPGGGESWHIANLIPGERATFCSVQPRHLGPALAVVIGVEQAEHQA